MADEFCPQCGRSLDTASRHPCRCKARRTTPEISGKKFVATLAILACLVALIAYGLYHAIPILRMQHGLSGFH